MFDLKEGVQELFEEAESLGVRHRDAELHLGAGISTDNRLARSKTNKAYNNLTDQHLRTLRPTYQGWGSRVRMGLEGQEKECIDCRRFKPLRDFIATLHGDRVREVGTCAGCREKNAARRAVAKPRKVTMLYNVKIPVTVREVNTDGDECKALKETHIIVCVHATSPEDAAQKVAVTLERNVNGD